MKEQKILLGRQLKVVDFHMEVLALFCVVETVVLTEETITLEMADTQEVQSTLTIHLALVKVLDQAAHTVVAERLWYSGLQLQSQLRRQLRR